MSVLKTRRGFSVVELVVALALLVVFYLSFSEGFRFFNRQAIQTVNEVESTVENLNAAKVLWDDMKLSGISFNFVDAKDSTNPAIGFFDLFSNTGLCSNANQGQCKRVVNLSLAGTPFHVLADDLRLGEPRMLAIKDVADGNDIVVKGDGSPTQGFIDFLKQFSKTNDYGTLKGQFFLAHTIFDYQIANTGRSGFYGFIFQINSEGKVVTSSPSGFSWQKKHPMDASLEIDTFQNYLNRMPIGGNSSIMVRAVNLLEFKLSPKLGEEKAHRFIRKNLGTGKEELLAINVEGVEFSREAFLPSFRVKINNYKLPNP